MSTRRPSPLSVELSDPHVCTPDERRQRLALVPFFADLSPEDIVEIDRRCRVEDVAPGEAVYLTGQPARRLYVVATGTAKVTRSSVEGIEVLLDVARPGDFFGALPVLGSDSYRESVWALTPLCVLSLDVQTFDEILDEHPSVARAGLAVMAGRLEHARAQAHALSVATSEQRIAAALVMLADRAGAPRGHGRTLLDLPLSRDDLAALTGTASETVSRVLAQLQRDGAVETGRRWVIVVDLPALRELAAI